jgi:two-component system cell cycle response regulator
MKSMDHKEPKFERRHWRARLALLDLRSGDLALGARLQKEIIQPHLHEIIESFYEVLFEHAETRHFLASEALVAHLQKAQREYLLSLGVDFFSRPYYESRLRVGLAHARVGLPVGIYQCAYCKLQQLILEHLPEHIRADDADREAMTTFVLKITSLDMSLALETFHLAEVRHLEASIGELRDAGEHLRQEATIDLLTGIANRKYVLETLARALEESHETGQPVSAIMVDLDHFKTVNDARGHLVGDDVLRAVVKRVASALRGSEMVGRYGGEEFLVVLARTPLETALEIAERIRRKVAKSPVGVRGVKVPMTLSLGVAEAGEGESLEDLVERADRALYAAKGAGRNCVAAGQIDVPAG